MQDDRDSGILNMWLPRLPWALTTSCQTEEGLETERESTSEQGIIQEVSWAKPGSDIFGWNSLMAPYNCKRVWEMWYSCVPQGKRKQVLVNDNSL